MKIDGLRGLFYIAEKYGRRLEHCPSDWLDDALIRWLQKENKNINIQKELEIKAEKNPFIRLYLENVRRTAENSKNYKDKWDHNKNLYDDYLQINLPFRSWHNNKKLDKEKIKYAADRLINSSDIDELRNYLSIFSRYKFPCDSNIILDLIKRKWAGRKAVKYYAISALGLLKSKEIRKFALDKIHHSNNPIVYLELLKSNYEETDCKMLTMMARSVGNADDIENLVIEYTDIFKVNKTKTCKKPLEALYAKTNCGPHRNAIVEILIENQVLSDNIKKEIRFDCDMQTRKLARQM